MQFGEEKDIPGRTAFRPKYEEVTDEQRAQAKQAADAYRYRDRRCGAPPKMHRTVEVKTYPRPAKLPPPETDTVVCHRGDYEDHRLTNREERSAVHTCVRTA